MPLAQEFSWLLTILPQEHPRCWGYSINENREFQTENSRRVSAKNDKEGSWRESSREDFIWMGVGQGTNAWLLKKHWSWNLECGQKSARWRIERSFPQGGNSISERPKSERASCFWGTIRAFWTKQRPVCQGSAQISFLHRCVLLKKTL